MVGMHEQKRKQSHFATEGKGIHERSGEGMHEGEETAKPPDATHTPLGTDLHHLHRRIHLRLPPRLHCPPPRVIDSTRAHLPALERQGSPDKSKFSGASHHHKPSPCMPCAAYLVVHRCPPLTWMPLRSQVLLHAHDWVEPGRQLDATLPC